jgi:hypothetical protein
MAQFARCEPQSREWLQSYREATFLLAAQVHSILTWLDDGSHFTLLSEARTDFDYEWVLSRNVFQQSVGRRELPQETHLLTRSAPATDRSSARIGASVDARPIG